jgi:hypothetical protein
LAAALLFIPPGSDSGPLRDHRWPGAGDGMHSVGLVLHPLRDCGKAVGAIVDWAAERGAKVYGIAEEIGRVRGAIAVSAE